MDALEPQGPYVSRSQRQRRGATPDLQGFLCVAGNDRRFPLNKLGRVHWPRRNLPSAHRTHADHRRFSSSTFIASWETLTPADVSHIQSFLWIQLRWSFQSSKLFCSSTQPTLYYIFILYKYTAHKVWKSPYSPIQMVIVSHGVVRSFQHLQRLSVIFIGIRIKKVQCKIPGQIIYCSLVVWWFICHLNPRLWGDESFKKSFCKFFRPPHSSNVYAF